MATPSKQAAKKPHKDDETLGKAYDGRLMRRLLGYLRPYRSLAALGIALSIAVAFLGPLRPKLIQKAIDDHIAVGDNGGLTRICLLLVGTLAAEAVLSYGLQYVTQLLGQRTILDLRMELFAKLQRMALRYFDRNPVGRLITRVTSDVEVLNDLFSSGIVDAFGSIFRLIFIVVLMATTDWRLTLVTLSAVPLLIYASSVFRRKVRVSYRDVRRQVARLNGFLQEHITGMSVVQIFGQETREYGKFEAINREHQDAHIRSVFYYAVFFPVVEFISSVAVALILWYGGGEVVQSRLSVGVLIAFTQFLEMFFRPIRDLSEKFDTLQRAMASSERIFELIDDETELPESAEPVEMGRVRGDIAFDHVSFAYEGDNFILKDISFTVKAGETVALVGATGAGKSSIINLLSRFYDVQRGTIRVDGHDIRTLSTRALRQNIGVVLQDVFLFSGDIRENITLGDATISDEQMREAARLVGADRFIERLPNGYDQAVKERGLTMSVGQRQLLAFVRALAYDPSILVLDEATSSVDTETELLIQEALDKLMQGRTSIVVAHRLSTVQKADRILVLHKGEIREQGTHQQLLALGGLYYRLYQLQYKDQVVRRTADSVS